MAYIRLQASFPRDSSIPSDTAQNVWHFLSDDETSAEDTATIARVKLETFYTAIEGYLSPTLEGTVNYVAYDLATPAPRVPIELSDGAIEPGVAAVPSEVAVVLSYNAAPAPGIAVARRRGRIYIGPLSTAAGEVIDGVPRPSETFREAIGNAAATLAATSEPDGTKWAVFSRTQAGPEPWTTGELLFAFAGVVGGYVDNAYDTQRRRGEDPTERSAWVV